MQTGICLFLTLSCRLRSMLRRLPALRHWPAPTRAAQSMTISHVSISVFSPTSTASSPFCLRLRRAVFSRTPAAWPLDAVLGSGRIPSRCPRCRCAMPRARTGGTPGASTAEAGTGGPGRCSSPRSAQALPPQQKTHQLQTNTMTNKHDNINKGSAQALPLSPRSCPTSDRDCESCAALSQPWKREGEGEREREREPDGV